MKKFILFSACLFLLSACNNDKPDAPEIQENPIFKVSMQDIQKAVRDALDNPINGMPNFDVPVIDAIDSIQADYRPAQSTEKTHYRKTPSPLPPYDWRSSCFCPLRSRDYNDP